VQTLVVRLGRRPALRLATLAAGLAFGCLLWGAWLRTGALSPAFGWRCLTLAVPAALWAHLLIPHLRDGGQRCGKAAMYAGLRAWAVTDLAAVLALAPL
jgi:4-hydroxybenzoate polyprenyltransferase